MTVTVNFQVVICFQNEYKKKSEKYQTPEAQVSLSSHCPAKFTDTAAMIRDDAASVCRPLVPICLNNISDPAEGSHAVINFLCLD